MKQFRVTRPGQYKLGSPGHDNHLARLGHYFQGKDANDVFQMACGIYPDNCFDLQEWEGNGIYGEPRRFCRE